MINPLVYIHYFPKLLTPTSYKIFLQIMNAPIKKLIRFWIKMLMMNDI